MLNSYQGNHLPEIIFSYCLLMYEKDLCLFFTYSALPLSLYTGDWINMTLLFPKRMAPEAVNPPNDVKAPRKTDMWKAISTVRNGVLAGLQNLDVNSLWPQKACFWVTEERVLLRNTGFMISLSVECKLLKAACLQPAFRNSSGSLVFDSQRNIKLLDILWGKKLYAGKIKALLLPQESITLMLWETVEGYLWLAMLCCTP